MGFHVITAGCYVNDGEGMNHGSIAKDYQTGDTMDNKINKLTRKETKSKQREGCAGIHNTLVETTILGEK